MGRPLRAGWLYRARAPVTLTATTTCPGPGVGSRAVDKRRTSGPPNWDTWICRMHRSSGVRCCSVDSISRFLLASTPLPALPPTPMRTGPTHHRPGATWTPPAPGHVEPCHVASCAYQARFSLVPCAIRILQGAFLRPSGRPHREAAGCGTLRPERDTRVALRPLHRVSSRAGYLRISRSQSRCERPPSDAVMSGR